MRDATGVPDSFAAMPAGGRAMQTWSYKIESHFSTRLAPQFQQRLSLRNATPTERGASRCT